MIVCLDFDGVLHDAAHPKPGRRMGPPIAGAYEAVRALLRRGHVVLVHTARAQTEAQLVHVSDWLDYYGFPNEVRVVLAKPAADVYLDDKGLRFRGDWDATLVQVESYRRAHAR
jgi:hypothetical protein